MTLSESNIYFQNPQPKQMELVFSETGEEDIVLTNEHIVSEEMSLEESICSEENLMFGTCEASCFKVRVVNNAEFKGRTLVVTQKIKSAYQRIGDSDGNDIVDDKGSFLVASNNSDNYTEIPYGTFKVYSDKPSNDRMWRDLVCYDAMYEILNAEVSSWYSGLTFPMTLKNLRDSFFTYLGITQETQTLINDDYVTKGGFTAEGSLSGKTIIEAICELNACFGHINRDGNFEYITLPSSNSVTLGWYIDGTGKFEDYTTDVITGVTARSEANDVGTSVGTDVNRLIIENNPLIFGDEGNQTLIDALDNILDAVETISYRPFSIDTYGNPCLPIGTNITYTTKVYDPENGYQDLQITTIVKSRTLKGIQGLVDSYSATGTQQRPSEANSLKSELLRTAGKVHKVTVDLDTFESEVSDAFEQTNSLIRQTASEIEMAVNGLDVISSYLAETKSGSELVSKIGYFENNIGGVSDEIYENLISTVFKPSSGITPTYTTLSNYYPDYEDYMGMYVAQNFVFLNAQGALRFDTPVEDSGWSASGNGISEMAVPYKEITIDLSDDDKFVDFIPEDNINATFRTTFTEVWNNTISGYCFIRLKLPALNSSLSVRDAYIFPVYYKGQILNHESEFQPIQGREYYIKIIPYSEISDARNPFGFKYVMAFLDEDSTTEWYTSQFQMLKDRIVLSVNSSNKVVAVELGIDPSTMTSLFQVGADNITLSANDVIDMMAGGTINMTSKTISISSTKFSVSSAGAVTCSDLTVTGGEIKLGGTSANPAFHVTNAGAVTCSNITATGGKIGGFDILGDNLVASGSSGGVSLLPDYGIYLINSSENTLTIPYGSLDIDRSQKWAGIDSSLNTTLTTLKTQVQVVDAPNKTVSNIPVNGVAEDVSTDAITVPSGYTPVCAVLTHTGSRHCTVYAYTLENSNGWKVRFSVRNFNTSSTASPIVRFKIICAKP